jgi:hypothetical protein
MAYILLLLLLLLLLLRMMLKYLLWFPAAMSLCVWAVGWVDYVNMIRDLTGNGARCLSDRSHTPI